MTDKRKKIVLEVDTGTDDAVALMCAILHPEIELLAACSVNGNQPIDITTENTLRVVELLNSSEIPVFRGCQLPMVSTLEKGRKPNMPRQSASAVHGDYLPIPPATIQTRKQHAVNFLTDLYLNTDEEIILVEVGPLTNLGMALRMEPKIAERIPRVVIMGGGHMIGNAQSATSEFNFWVDPESAKIVAQSGIPLTIVPLDATHAAYITREEANRLCQSDSIAAQVAGKFILNRINGYSLSDHQMREIDAAPVHDALAIASLVDEFVLKDIHHCYMDVECRGELTDGRSVFDVLQKTANKPNCDVAFDADRVRFRNFLFETLTRTDH